MIRAILALALTAFVEPAPALFLHVGQGCGNGSGELEMTATPGQAVFSGGALYWADKGCRQIRRLVPGGTVQLLAVTADPPEGVAHHAPSGAVFYTTMGAGGALLFVREPSGTVRPLPTTGITTPTQLAVVGDWLYIADLTGTDGRGGIHRMPVPCVGCPPSGPALVYGGDTVWRPSGLAPGPHGALYIADTANARILRRDSAGGLTTVAGQLGVRGFAGDGGPATQALLNFPEDLAVGDDGTIYVADTSNSRVRRIGPDGVITTVLGRPRGVGEQPKPPIPGADPLNTYVPILTGIAYDVGGGRVYVGSADPVTHGFYYLDADAAPAPTATRTNAPATATATATVPPTATRTVPPTSTATATRTPSPAPTCVPECVAG